MKTNQTAISRILSVLSMIVLLFLQLRMQAAAKTDKEMWPGLKPGLFSVGYRLLHTYDGSRLFGKLGKRPIQITVWYPARPDAEGRQLTIESYLLSAATELDFPPVPGQRKTKHRDEVLDMAMEAGAEAGKLQGVLDRMTMAIRETPPAPGPFPLLLYAPGKGAPAFQNLVLCEYLASHGYVVAACPSVGKEEREVADSAEGLEPGKQDLDFALTEVSKLFAVDSKRIGLIGFSYGGMVAPLLAMHNEAVGALMLLDPGFRVNSNYRILMKSPLYRPQRIKQPMLVMLAKGKETVPDLGFLHAIATKDLKIIIFNNFFHGDFASAIIELFVHPIVGEHARDITGIDIGYASVCRYAKAFFDSHLKTDPLAQAFLKRRPEENGIPAGMLTMENVLQKNSTERK